MMIELDSCLFSVTRAFAIYQGCEIVLPVVVSTVSTPSDCRCITNFSSSRSCSSSSGVSTLFWCLHKIWCSFLPSASRPQTKCSQEYVGEEFGIKNLTRIIPWRLDSCPQKVSRRNCYTATASQKLNIFLLGVRWLVFLVYCLTRHWLFRNLNWGVLNFSAGPVFPLQGGTESRFWHDDLALNQRVGYEAEPRRLLGKWASKETLKFPPLFGLLVCRSNQGCDIALKYGRLWRRIVNAVSLYQSDYVCARAKIKVCRTKNCQPHFIDCAIYLVFRHFLLSDITLGSRIRTRGTSRGWRHSSIAGSSWKMGAIQTINSTKLWEVNATCLARDATGHSVASSWFCHHG